MRFVHRHSWSKRGRGAGLFEVRITGLAVDSEGLLYAVGDRKTCTLKSDGEVASESSTRDAGWSICPDGNALWIGMQGGAERVDAAGNMLDRIDDAPRLGLVTGIAAHGDRVLIADATHKKLQLYERGRWLHDVGSQLNTRGFMIPNGVLVVAFDSNHRQFVVAHPQKHRVERYDLDGVPVGMFGKFGNEAAADFGGCCNPNTIATGPDGLIVVSEKAPPRLKAYTREGRFLAASSEEAFDPSAKNLAIAVDGRRVYAADPTRCVIEAFDLVGE